MHLFNKSKNKKSREPRGRGRQNQSPAFEAPEVSGREKRRELNQPHAIPPEYPREEPPPPPPPTQEVEEKTADEQDDYSQSQPPVRAVESEPAHTSLDPRLEETAKKLGALCIGGDKNYDLIKATLDAVDEDVRQQMVSHAVNRQFTPLMYAAQQPSERLCQLFLDYGAEASINTTFEHAARHGSFANHPGYTALHFACHKHLCEKNVELLCTHHANVNMLEENGYTPMHLIALALSQARTQRHPDTHVRLLEEIARILNDCGADLGVRAVSGKTAGELFPDLDAVLRHRSECHDALIANRGEEEREMVSDEVAEQPSRQQNADLEEMLRQKDREIELLRAEKEMLETRLRNEVDVVSVEIDNTGLQTKCDQLEGERTALLERVNALEQEKDKLVAAREDAEEKEKASEPGVHREHLEAEMAEMGRTIVSTANDLEVIHEQLKVEQQRGAALALRNADLALQVANLSEPQEKKKKNWKRPSKAEMEALKRQISDLRVENEELQNAIQHSEEAHGASKSRMTRQLSAMEVTIAEERREVLGVLGIEVEVVEDFVGIIRSREFRQKGDTPQPPPPEPEPAPEPEPEPEEVILVPDVDVVTPCVSVLSAITGEVYRVETVDACLEVAEAISSERIQLQSEVVRVQEENQQLEGKLLVAEEKVANMDRMQQLYEDQVRSLSIKLMEVEEKEKEVYEGQMMLFKRFADVEYDESPEMDMEAIPTDVEADEIEDRRDIEYLELDESGTAPSRFVLVRGTKRVPFAGRDMEFFTELTRPMESGIKFYASNYISMKYVRDTSSNEIYLYLEYFNKAQALEAYQIALIEYKKFVFCAALGKLSNVAPAASNVRSAPVSVAATVASVPSSRPVREEKCDVCGQTIKSKFTVRSCNHSYCSNCARRRIQKDVERNHLPECAVCADENVVTKISAHRAAQFLNTTQQRTLQQILKRIT